MVLSIFLFASIGLANIYVRRFLCVEVVVVLMGVGEVLRVVGVAVVLAAVAVVVVVFLLLGLVFGCKSDAPFGGVFLGEF